MGYIDLIPDVFRLTMPDLATGKSYHTQKFNVGNKQCIGVTIKASQALSVAVAYGIATDTAAAAGVDIAASLPYKTSATSFASNTSTEGGTYHEIAVPPHARQAQLVISNASGSTVSGAVIDAALRVVAYPAASGSGSSDFASITGWPGSSSQFVHADGSYSPLSASDIPNLSTDKLTSGTLPVGRGGTGLTALGTALHGLRVNAAGNALEYAAISATPTFAGISCSKTSNQSVTLNTATDITFTVEIIAETSHISHSTSTNPAEFTINTTGKYRISGRLSVAPTSGSSYSWLWGLLKLGSTTLAQVRGAMYGSSIADATGGLPFDWVYSLTSGDVIKIQAYNQSLNFDVLGLSSAIDQTTICIEYLGA